MEKIKKEKIINDVRNLFRLEKEIDVTTVKDIRNPFRLKKSIEAIKYRAIGDIRNIFQHKEENYHNRIGK